MNARHTRRSLLKGGAKASALVALGPLAAACGSSSSSKKSTSGATTSGASGGGPHRGGTLTFARSVAPTQLDPANSIIAGDIYTLDKLFEPLYVTDAAGQLVPWLATGHRTSADHRTWTFALRPGVRFSDGTPLRADDVVWSIDRERHNSDGPLSFLDTAIKSIRADGQRSVVFTLSEPWAPFLSDVSVFANAVLPKSFGGRSEKAFFQKPVGTGPWLLPSWQADSNLTLKRNPHYWRSGRPYLDEVVVNYVTDQNQQMLQLTGGQAQLIDNVAPSNVSSLKGRGGVVVTDYPSWQVDLLVFNEQVAQFKDVHVRRAIAQAIDTAKLVEATTFGTAKAGGSFIAPSLQYYDAHTPVLAYDQSKAKAELAKSRYPHGFDTKLLISGGVEKWSSFAQIIQAALKPLGINVSITSLDHAAYESTFQKYEYDMFIDYSINDISDIDEMVSFNLDYKSGGSKSYWSSYDDPSLIALIHRAQTTFDTAQRATLYARIQAIVAAEVPFVALDYPPYIYAHSDKVNGFAVNPGGAYRLEDVWLS